MMTSFGRRSLAPPALAALLLCVALLFPLMGSRSNAAEETKEPSSAETKRDKAREGHVFTEEDLIFDTTGSDEPGKVPKTPTTDPPISIKANFARGDLRHRFSQFYSPPAVSITLGKSHYRLPIDQDDIINLDQVLDGTSISYYGRKKLLEQGILSVSFGGHDDFVRAYERVENLGLTPLITSDAVLHLYQIHLSATLTQIEKFTMTKDLENLTRAFVKEFDRRLSNVFSAQLNSTGKSSTKASTNQGTDNNEVAVTAAVDSEQADLAFQENLYAMGLAYFSVALVLIDPDTKVHPHVAEIVQQELALSRSRPGIQQSPLLQSDIDYGRFEPRRMPAASARLRAHRKALA
ncbi:MAG: DUF3160 domain-containing protein, partial [Deltaproteobacteria bacterium]|nr:DUF3160 domain-containing protein [Deltaproteobacteria bacterium]